MDIQSGSYVAVMDVAVMDTQSGWQLWQLWTPNGNYGQWQLWTPIKPPAAAPAV